MDKRQTTKIVVNNLVGFGLGTATGTVVRSAVPRSNNPVIDFAVSASVVVTSWFAAATIHNPVRAESDRQIDALFDFLAEAKTTN